MVVALVTGANSGIGEAVAHQLAKQPDHHVVIAARNPEAGAKVAADLVAAGGSASSVQLEVPLGHQRAGPADPNTPPKGTRDYYESVAKVLPDVNDFLRVFEVPGPEHCSGGTGGQPTTIFDQMRAWVENGTVPETLPISFTDAKNETQNRILCPLPLKTTFNATCGDGARAECFYCAQR
ncbi:hypothetical protein FJTKL_01718 [Diaporthe vaccinii]|uniref:Carboxylic ester hydrolase n=1 Tax=Diaporthe vaccinii TaxID=105482 RepID=A0ABR4F3Z7_9PEZI